MNFVILAAGMGKRMHSRLPKVLQPLAGRPMLDHVLDATEGFSESPRVVVVGHCAEEVRARYSGRNDLVLHCSSHSLVPVTLCKWPVPISMGTILILLFA